MQLSQFLICSAEMFSPARIEFISGSAEFRSQIGGIGLAGSRHNQKRGLTVDDRSLAVSSRTEIHASRRNLLALSRLLCEPMARLPVLRPREVVRALNAASQFRPSPNSSRRLP